MGKPDKDDADVLLKLYELRREPELRKAREWFGREYSPEAWEKTKAVFGTGTDEDRYIRMVTSYWDMVAAFVNNGILNEDLFFQTNGENLFVWNKAKTWVSGRRAATKQPYYLWNLEKLCERHQAYRENWGKEISRSTGT
jgi:hypothetical protein